MEIAKNSMAKEIIEDVWGDIRSIFLYFKLNKYLYLRKLSNKRAGSCYMIRPFLPMNLFQFCFFDYTFPVYLFL